MLCCTRETFTGRYTNLILKTTEWMIYKVLSLYYVHRFPTPYQLPYFVLDNFESLLFSLRLDLPFCVGIYQSYQIDSVFPPSIRPLSTMLWSRAVVSRVEYNWLTNRFHVAVRLFSNRSQMTSKCRKNKEVRLVCHCCFYHILTSSVIYYWTDPRKHGIYLFYTMIRKEKRLIYIPASYRLTARRFVLIWAFLVPDVIFRLCFFFFSLFYLYAVLVS